MLYRGIGVTVQLSSAPREAMIYLKSTLVGLAAALAMFVVFWLFALAVSTVGLAIDIPSWHFVLPILWSGPMIGFGIGFALAWRKLRKRLGHGPPA
jgi:hypothetical protein